MRNKKIEIYQTVKNGKVVLMAYPTKSKVVNVNNHYTLINEGVFTKGIDYSDEEIARVVKQALNNCVEE